MFLGIDIGTTATKAILADERLRRLAVASTGYETGRPRPGVSEFDPDAWIEAVRRVLADLRAQAPAAWASVRAIGLSGQMHSLVVAGADDRPVRPAILWNDGRGAIEAEALRRDLPGIGAVTGVVPMPSFTATKLLWLKGEAPGDFDRIRRVVFCKDYVRHWLTGEWATDVSDAAGGQFLDERARGWWPPVLDRIGLDPAVLPPLLEGTERAGRLRPALAAELGLAAGLPVAAGGGDTAVAALGLGCVGAGDAFASIGTGMVLVSVAERYEPAPDEALLHGFAHCIPERWYRMAAMLNGASCLAWAARLTGEPSIEAMLSRVSASGPGRGDVLFQPYLRGERTPHNDVHARGAFVGLDAATEGPDLCRAVLEGVAFSLRQARDSMREAGSALDQLLVVGGGARSSLWMGILASVLDCPLRLAADADHAGAAGAALLGAVAAGEGGERIAAPRPAVQVVEPDPRRTVAYSDLFETWLQLYPAVKPLRRQAAHPTPT